MLSHCLTLRAQSTADEIESRFHKAIYSKRISADSLLLIGKDILRKSNALGIDLGAVQGQILMGRGFLRTEQLDSASTYLLAAIQTTERIAPESFEEGLAHNYMGSVFTRLNNHRRALQEFQTATAIFKTIKNPEFIAIGLSNTGTAYLSQDDMIKALELLLEAQKVASNGNVSENQRANILSNISIVYNVMGKKREALNFAFSALKLDVDAKNKFGICQSYNAIGNIYMMHADYDSALYFFNKTRSTADAGNREFDQVVLRALRNTADIYTRQNNFQKAASFLRRIQKTNSEHATEIVHSYLARYYMKLKMYDSAIYFSRSAIRKARQAGSKSALVSSFGNLNNAFLAKGRLDSAYHYLGLQFAYSDSLSNEKDKKSFENLRIQLETLDKEQELFAVKKQAEVDKATDKLLLVFVVATFMVVVMGLVSMILLYKNKQKQGQLKTLALEDQLMKSRADLRNQTLRMIHINNGMHEIEASLKKIRAENTDIKVGQVLKNIELNQSLEKEWEMFNEYFGSIHVGFYDRLEAEFPKLTIAEKRLAGLVRMNLTNREIAAILSIEDASVKTAKHRLKKKLNLTDEQDLNTFLNQLTKDEMPKA